MKQASRVAALIACAIIGCAASAPPALAVEEHAFDAKLSLTGGCNPNSASKEADPIPDPGCPGGTHPAKEFDNPCGTAVDSHGDIYVASSALGTNGSGTGGRIDVFDPEGKYLTEIADEHQSCSVAVDSEGNVYVAEYKGKDTVLFGAEEYPPAAGDEYEPPVIIHEPNTGDGCGGACTQSWSVAVDPSDDHLYLAVKSRILEYGSAAEGSPLIEEDIGKNLPPFMDGIDVYGANHDLYVTGAVSLNEHNNPRVYILDGASGEVKCEIDGGFGWVNGSAGLAVDQANGDVYVDDSGSNHLVKQFDSQCEPVGQLPSPPVLARPIPFADVAVDDPCLDEAGEPCNPAAPYESPDEGYVFVGSGATATSSHLYSYKPKVSCPPEVRTQLAGAITETEAVLSAELNPCGAETTYRFQYTTRTDFEAQGYAGASEVPLPEADAGEGGSFLPVSAPVAGLEAGTAYRFRLVASNEEGTTLGEGMPGQQGGDAGFATYPEPPSSPVPCPNEALRQSQHSTYLPDCRAYELVTPPETNGRIPTMSELARNNDDGFDTSLASLGGEGLAFGTEGGSLPGLGGGGFHDTYEATRGPGGWQSAFRGLSGGEAPEPYPGGIAADHGYAFWRVAGDKGSLPEGNYLRGADGSIEPIGLGGLGEDLEASGKWISAGGAQVIFTSTVRLSEEAPAGVAVKIYDRSPGAATRLISLKPDGTPFEADSEYQGTDAAGDALAFKVNGTLYLRTGGETRQVASGDPLFGGLSEGGGRLAYLIPAEAPSGTEAPHGDIFSYDAAGETASMVGSGGESTLVNVSPDGSHVYFVSPKQLDGTKGAPGAENLYAWDSAAKVPRFIATLTERDVIGEPAQGTNGKMTDGLGLWVNGAIDPNRTEYNGPGADPSRSTPEKSSVFLFESRAKLGVYENAGHSEVYRYEAASSELRCLSCNPTGEAGRSDAQLQSPPGGQFIAFPPVNSLARLQNVSADGEQAFFQSVDPLVHSDVDNKTDVYEWEAEGTGGCALPAGCLSLISYGHSAANDYLYAMAPGGHDVFFETADPLLPADAGGASIYDARVEGGFAAPEAPPPPCQDAGGCRETPPAPPLATPATGPFPGGGNVRPRRCPRGTRKVRRGGKVRCARRHRHRGRSR